MIKIVTIVGARPQFIKAAAVSRVIRDEYSDRIEEVIVHTGQHFDPNMSEVFFKEMDIPEPKYKLEVSGGGHGEMTGRMLEAIERVLLEEKPQWVLVYGDTNSTLAGALAAAKLHIPISHVEAGLRSFNMRMPEEVNRILADRVSTKLFCPTNAAVKNLMLDGIVDGVYNVGDVMYDASIFYKELSNKHSKIKSDLAVENIEFGLVTCHRAENTDSPERLNQILSALGDISNDIKLVLPLHPRTYKKICEYGFEHIIRNITLTPPLPFLDMIALEQSANVIFTDSGGVQKEAFFYQVPCITMRNETEWVETVSLGCNVLVDANQSAIKNAFYNVANTIKKVEKIENPYGDGNASSKIITNLLY